MTPLDISGPSYMSTLRNMWLPFSIFSVTEVPIPSFTGIIYKHSKLQISQNISLML